ncbi:MAG TPA: pyridoxal-dependent decarboxylase [Dongiaceae bacterium]|nr:pyridoxal-dependent decarboxylase [Dongiaceae bacterium]
MTPDDPALTGESLDPADWQALRAQGHRMLDDILDYLQHIEDRPVWQKIPEEVRGRFREGLPRRPATLAAAHERFLRDVLPYATGNAHPGFMGWVHGAGTPVGLLAEMLAAGLNANLGGRDHMPIEVERQILHWMRELFGFPATASGLFVTGTSMANLMAVLIARTAALGYEVRRRGLAASERRLTAYASSAAHGCVRQALDLSGIGSDALRLVPTDARRRIEIGALAAAVAADRSRGFTPFLLVGSAGTVDVGAVDDLDGLADLAGRERLWFHVDAAYGALGLLAADLAPLFRGIERSDSVAFDFHKWGQVPYDAGYLLVRDGERHRASFAAPASYLRRETRGLAAGSPWPCDFGPDLSRGFRALKAWFTFTVLGAEAIGAAISRSCALARYLERKVAAEPALELLAPAQLNIVCFRYRAADADRVNAAIVADLHESGIAAPSATTLDGRLAIRAAIVNHRTRPRHIDAMIAAVLRFGAARML